MSQVPCLVETNEAHTVIFPLDALLSWGFGSVSLRYRYHAAGYRGIRHTIWRSVGQPVLTFSVGNIKGGNHNKHKRRYLTRILMHRCRITEAKTCRYHGPISMTIMNLRMNVRHRGKKGISMAILLRTE